MISPRANVAEVRRKHTEIGDRENVYRRIAAMSR
jgi:hypothetical protein